MIVLTRLLLLLFLLFKLLKNFYFIIRLIHGFFKSSLSIENFVLNLVNFKILDRVFIFVP